MEIKRLGNSRLSIRISEPELTALGFSCEMVDCASQATEAMVLALLEIAEKEVGFQPEDCLVVRIEPLEDGGCLLLFSSPQDRPPRRWKVRRHAASPVIYAFSDVDALIGGSVKLFQRYAHRIRKSMLYRINGEWRLAVYPLDILENRSLAVLDEFGPRWGEGPVAAAWLDEHAELLIEKDAIDLLSSYFG